MHDEIDPGFEEAVAKGLGPVYDRVFESVDVFAAGVDDVIAEEVNVTVREAAAVAGWVGIVATDLSRFADLKLELRVSGEVTPFTVMFLIGPRGETLIRGTGPAPGGATAVSPEHRPHMAPVPPELIEDLGI